MGRPTYTAVRPYINPPLSPAEHITPLSFGEGLGGEAVGGEAVGGEALPSPWGGLGKGLRGLLFLFLPLVPRERALLREGVS